MVRMITPNTHTSLIDSIQHETIFLGLRRDQRRGPGDLVPCRRRQGSVVGAEVGQRSRPSSRLGGARPRRFTSFLFGSCEEGEAVNGQGEILSCEKGAWSEWTFRVIYASLRENEPFQRLIRITTPVTHDTHLIRIWYSFDTHLILIWYSCDTHTIPNWYSWYSSDTHLILIWYSIDTHLILIWYSFDTHNTHVIRIWYAFDTHMILMWYSSDTHMILMILIWYAFDTHLILNWYSFDTHLILIWYA